MEYYTLLADDQQRISHSDEMYPYFRAHIIYNMIVGGGMVFSDNQIICSKNLRKLAQEDGVVRELFREKRVGLAIRESFIKEGASSLNEIFDAFDREGKIKYASKIFSPELVFIEKHSVKRPWKYESVRQNYTRTCLKIIDEQFQKKLSAVDHSALMDLLYEEKERDGGGLGREFLRYRLPEALGKKNLIYDEQLIKLLHRCTEAPYLSNLPETIGLNPIYTEQQKPSFDLLRGHHCDLQDSEDPTDLHPKLDYKHFIHGLNRLDIDDIFSLLDLPAFKAYRKILKQPDAQTSVDDLHQVFVEMNIQIEDSIVSRFPEIKTHSTEADSRKVRKVFTSVIENGSTVLLDAVGVGLQFAGSALFIPGIAITPLINKLKKKTQGPERSHFDSSLHQVRMRKLNAYLKANGKSETITLEENIKQDSTFANEVIVS